MSTYTFKFCTGESTTVEVSEEWVTLLEDEDRREYNNDHAQTRRHCSLEAYNLDDALLPSDTDVEGSVIAADDEDDLHRRLLDAIDKLTPAQRDLVENIILGDMLDKTYAAKLGISPAAVSQRKATVMKKLKKFFEKP